MSAKRSGERQEGMMWQLPRNILSISPKRQFFVRGKIYDQSYWVVFTDTAGCDTNTFAYDSNRMVYEFTHTID